MSGILSSLIVIGLSLMALLPLVLAWLRPRTGGWVLGFYALAFFAILVSRSDFSVRAPPPESLAGPSTPELTDDTCSEALTLAEQGRIILDRSISGRVVVQGAVWRELPEQARNSLVGCVARSWRDRQGGEVQVIEQ